MKFNDWKKNEMKKSNEEKSRQHFEKLEQSKKFSEEILEKRRHVSFILSSFLTKPKGI